MSGHQDGLDRLELPGPVTAQKHAKLPDYAEKLCPKWQSYQVALSVRDPFASDEGFGVPGCLPELECDFPARRPQGSLAARHRKGP